MSSNVRIAYPIILMNEKREGLPQKRVWMAHDSIFAVEIPGDTVYLDKEDFLFFGRRSGARYFISCNERGEPVEYSMLTGSRTLSKESKSMDPVKVVEGDPLFLPLLPQEPANPCVPEEDCDSGQGLGTVNADSPPDEPGLVGLSAGGPMATPAEEVTLPSYEEKVDRARPGFWKKPLGQCKKHDGNPRVPAIKFLHLTYEGNSKPPDPTGRWVKGQLRMPTNKGGTRTPCYVTNPLDGKIIDLSETVT